MVQAIDVRLGKHDGMVIVVAAQEGHHLRSVSELKTQQLLVEAR